jgi:hypothetical protein
MKIHIGPILILIAINCASAQVALIEHEWKVTLKVVDESGQPVAAARANVGYFSKSQPKSIDGLTDTNGIFKASHLAYSGILGFTAEKAGYYTTREPSYELGFTYDQAKWNPTQTIILRKIGNPIPMYARKMLLEFPTLDKPIGFDLVKGDWVAPYGNGSSSDFIFNAQRRFVDWQDFDSSFKLTFSNDGDGLAPLTGPSKLGSALRISAIAPGGGYEPEISQFFNHTPTKRWEKSKKEDQNYYFRIRTSRDKNGNIKNAIYGKIYGDFSIDAINSKTMIVSFQYYLNPTPNDRNMEFDPKRNLMKNLGPLEGVTEP